MRLTALEQSIIREKTREVFGDGVSVFLFGSRTDDSKKGGDIDLFIEGDEIKESVKKKITLMTELQFRLGERKIDIVTSESSDTEEVPLIVKIARETGIKL